MKLYDYQEKIVDQATEILFKHEIVLIHAEMRTGKTPMALALIERVFDLIPKSCQKRALFLSKKVALTDISKNVSTFHLGALEGQIEVINYESVHKISKNARFDVIILDEYHVLSAFPRLNTRQKAVNAIFRANPQAKAILLSGTSNVESRSQIFHPLRITGKLYSEYNNFYKWFREYGIPKTMRIGARQVNVYDETHEHKVLDSVKHLCVSLTQSEAGFEHKTKVTPVYLKNERLKGLIDALERDQVISIGNSLCVAPSAVSVLNKSLQICGSTVKCEDEDGNETLEYLNERYKIDFIELVKAKKVAVFTNFIAERDYIISALGSDRCTEDMTMFKHTDTRYFVGSLQSYSEGFDLSMLPDTKIVLYSLCWSGSKFAQICERQQNKQRKEPVEILCPILDDSPERALFQAVSSKRNFNSRFLKDNGFNL